MAATTAAASTPTASAEMTSATSYRSTPSSRSSVMERAREYTRRIDDSARRAQSVERNAAARQMQTAARSESAGRSPLGPGEADGEGLPYAQQQQQQPSRHSRSHSGTPRSDGNAAPEHAVQRPRGSPSRRSRASNHQEQHPAQQQQQQQEAVVSPELLVDALSGHEDGLLAIAEKLMEHYDSGYDVMGEAIIDAFADVQKLFQHVVEAAHMEGAAFEASRREEEIQDLRQQLAAAGGGTEDDPDFPGTAPTTPASSANGASMRVDEFVDQDVKDCLTKAIRQGSALRGQNQHQQCFQLFEQACQSASALLPVDSDHRARLQLSLARAESMSPDRACAILRYAMDDVLRSGMRAGKTPLPDPSKRTDVVLTKPKGHSSMNATTGQAGVMQSSEEALNSLVEEMKDVISAPIYDNTPVRDISERFWAALSETQKLQNRNEERLEHNLGKFKGEFLMARAEWEEKLNAAQEMAETYKRKYMVLKGDSPDDAFDESLRGSSSMGTLGGMASAGSYRSTNTAQSANDFANGGTTGPKPYKSSRGVESVASLGSSMAQHARSLVGSFACSGINERTGGVLATELAEDQQRRNKNEWREKRSAAAAAATTTNNANSSKSFKDYTASPKRVDL